MERKHIHQSTGNRNKKCTARKEKGSMLYLSLIFLLLFCRLDLTVGELPGRQGRASTIDRGGRWGGCTKGIYTLY